MIMIKELTEADDDDNMGHLGLALSAYCQIAAQYMNGFDAKSLLSPSTQSNTDSVFDSSIEEALSAIKIDSPTPLEAGKFVLEGKRFR
jgi:hypothetical protein